ncbi:MAG: hypothetical protein HZA13_07715 [Nitrospirae bacterium]|nr:hypothetical protein [Nitrospirota bacterium]
MENEAMLIRQFKQFIPALLFLLIFLSDIARGQPYREGLSIPPAQIFNGINGFAKSGDYEKIEKSLQLLTPLLTALSQKYGIDYTSEIRSAIAVKDKDKVLKGIQRLIFSDMKDLFDQADLVIKESKDKAQVKFKTAFLDYLLLGPFVEAKNFPSDGKIKRGFRDIQFTIDSSAPYGTSGGSAISPETIKKMSDEILREIQTVLPELK